MKGMFPSKPGEIKLNVLKEQEDHFLLMSEQCDRFDFLMDRYKHARRYQNIMKYSQDMRERVGGHCNATQDTLHASWTLFDTLNVAQINKLQ